MPTETPEAVRNGPQTYQDLVDERGRISAQIDDILDTAREAERALTPDERETHDYLVWCLESTDENTPGLETQIQRARQQAEDAARFAGHEVRRSQSFHIPSVNVISANPPSANRSLDELLWATAEEVPAGSFGKTGQFVQHANATNAVEQVAVRSQNDDIVLAPRIDEFLPEHRQAVRAFQQTVADMALFGLLVDKSAKSSSEGFEAARSHKIMRGRWEQICRALDVDTSAEGGTWVPTGIGANLHEKVRQAGKIAALFARIDLPTNPWKWPIEGADATAYRVAEPTSDTATKVTASTPGTVAATFDAEILGGRVLFSRSLEADSALAILPYARMKLVRAFVDAEEKAILDGDTDGTHQDSDTQSAGATHASSSWDGLRKKGLAQTSVDGASATASASILAGTRAAMGKYGVNPADLAFIIGVSHFHDLIADTAVLTVDKMGPQATILNGQVASLYGVPVVVSEHVREDLNASGVHDGITETESYVLCVNRMEWAMGQRMALDVEVDDSIYRETFQRVVVGFMREDFQHIGDAATNDDTAITFEVSP